MNFRWLNALLWGNSVALSWMWGLGLFFSVQITFMFGLQGLLLFAIPNALGLMLFGFLTHRVAESHSGGQFAATAGLDGFKYAHDLVTQYFHTNYKTLGGLMPLAYFSFLAICALTTLDSGYIALKWFLGKNVEKSENMLISLIPKQIIGSPIPTFLLVGLITLGSLLAGLELEYFMVFYASFFVGYAALAIARCFVPNSQQPLPQIRMFSMASMSLAIFAFGYLKSDTALLILGSILPLAYVMWLVFNADLLRVVTERAGEVIEAAAEIPAIKAIAKTVHVATASDVVAPQDHHALGGHFEGKWFVYSMIATYQDTNSVGNVYFGMYGLFVGKTRELFFNVAMPDFDLKTTKFYILTRSFEHKFVREAREFDTITVKIKVADFNRKFCTLEHQIFGSDNELLGKGKQSLLFVSSKDYSLLDIPPEVYTAFIKYT